jgi:DNA-binding GntR family transcriptional regulator
MQSKEPTDSTVDASSDSGQGGDTMTDRAYRQIEEAIITLRLRPGQVLSETQLADSLDIGRTPVREALQRLAREGMITVLPRRGALVSEINLSKQLMLLELRREIERLCARKAAQRTSPEEREAFSALADQLGRAASERDDAAFMRLDLQFNQMLLAASRNEFAERAMHRIQGLSRRFWFQHYRESLDLEKCATLHEKVARAIASGDGDKAAAASDDLIDYIVEFTRSTI